MVGPLQPSLVPRSLASLRSTGPSNIIQTSHSLEGGYDRGGGGRGYEHCHMQTGTWTLTGKGFRCQHVAEAQSPSETKGPAVPLSAADHTTVSLKKR